MERVELKYNSSSVPTVRDFVYDNHFVIGLMGPFGSGKSSGLVQKLMRHATEQEPAIGGVHKGKRCSRWGVIRNTNKELEDTTINTFQQWLPFGDFEWNSTKKNLTIDTDEVHIEIMFRALDREDQLKDLLSLELTGAVINEAREIHKSIFEGVQGRVGRYPRVQDGGCKWFGVMMDTNPPDDDSWWYEYFEEIKPENAIIYKQPSGLSKQAENRIHLPANYYENLALGKDDEWIKVYIEGQYGYVQDGKPVYPEYNDNIHCKEFECSPKTILRGWDFGLTPSVAFAYLHNGQLRVFDELVGEDMGVDRYSDQLLDYCIERYPDAEFVDLGDPAGNQRAQTDEKTCFDILWGKNINIKAGDQDPNIRIECVKYPLNKLSDGEPAFLLHRRCRMLRKGFQGRYKYRRVQGKNDRYTDKPDKNEYSHIHDALQYLCTHVYAARLRGRIQEEEVKRPIDDDLTFMDVLQEQINANAEQRELNERI
jgi:hypothetical protein